MTRQTELLSSKKRKNDSSSEEEIDHRKRRRNRTTQSCLNCHGSKRLCDRKRPACGRCVKLGLSGICVYQVDDINQRSSAGNETEHLKSRIAELEGFIREFKRKPHPRWAADLLRSPHPSDFGDTLDDANGEPSSSPTPSDTNPYAPLTTDVVAQPHFSRGSSECTSPSTSPPTTPQSDCDGPVFLTSPECIQSTSSNSRQSTQIEASLDAFPSHFSNENMCSSSSSSDSDFLEDGDVFGRVFDELMCPQSRQPVPSSCSSDPNGCDCMQKASAYSVMLELAPHIRRAIDALRSLPEHQLPGTSNACRHLKLLKELDSAISDGVASISNSLFPPLEISQMSAHAIGYPSLAPSAAYTAKQSLAMNNELFPVNSSGQSDVVSVRDTNVPSRIEVSSQPRSSFDNFMSWDPQSMGLDWMKFFS